MTQVAEAPSRTVPPLCNGDRLSLREFEERWEQNEHIKKAELLDGVVYLEMTVSALHAQSHALVFAWVTGYWATHPAEVVVYDNPTVRLGRISDIQPDVAVRRLDSTGSAIDSDGVIEGPPEFVVEIAASSASYDLHVKKEIYRAAGVLEYVVWQLYENRLDWFELRDGDYTPREPDTAGVIESVALAGLRLPVDSLLRGDLAALLAAHTQANPRP